jgi:uncharacterized UBP type Zn finger protein
MKFQILRESNNVTFDYCMSTFFMRKKMVEYLKEKDFENDNKIWLEESSNCVHTIPVEELR